MKETEDDKKPEQSQSEQRQNTSMFMLGAVLATLFGLLTLVSGFSGLSGGNLLYFLLPFLFGVFLMAVSQSKEKGDD